MGKIYASEIQPAHTRAAANCVAQGLGFFTNWIVAMLTPVMLAQSAFGAYFLFGFLALGTVAVLFTYMPETRGRTLEDIQEAFHRPVVQSWMHHLKRLTLRGSPRGQSVSSDESIELSDILANGPTTGSSAQNSTRGLRMEMA